MNIDFSNPAKLYFITWYTALFLFWMKICNFYVDVSNELILLISISFVALLFQGFIFKIFYRNKKDIIVNKYLEDKISKAIKILFIIFFIGNIITIIIDGGLPFFWYLIGSSKTYDDFGLPTFQGFLNSVYCVMLLCIFFLYSRLRKKNYIAYVYLLLTYPILIMSRGLLVMALLEILGMYIFSKSFDILKLFKLLLLFISFIWIFGVIGDLRLGEKARKSLDLLITTDYIETFETIPSGFFWVYLYSTTSINNLEINIKNNKPVYYPKNSFKSLIPSVIQQLIYKNYGERVYDAEMGNEAFNTFTIYTNYLIDFGYYGAIIIFSIISFFFVWIYYKAKSGNPASYFMYPVFFQVFILSIFSDFILILPVIFQIILIQIIFKNRNNSHV